MEPWLALPLTFAIGGIPFGFLAVKLIRGEDVRTVGSGNIGATNAARCFAGPWRPMVFAAIYALDFAKGFLPPLLLAATEPRWAAPAIGLAAVAGHCFSPYLGFRGGKGVATGCGALAALDPVALAAAIAAFAVVFALVRITALGSLALGFALPLAVILREPATAFGSRWATSALALLLAFLFVWTHRTNLQRLLRERQARRQQATG